LMWVPPRLPSSTPHRRPLADSPNRCGGVDRFDAEESVDAVFQAGDRHDVDHKRVEIKRAVPKESMPIPPRNGGPGGGRGQGGA
jgi:hypothetical protein